MTIQITDRTIRLGTETRRLRFRDHYIGGWAFRGDDVTTEGTWTTTDWTRAEIAAWIRDKRHWDRLRWTWLRRLLRAKKPRDYQVTITDNMFFGTGTYQLGAVGIAVSS